MPCRLSHCLPSTFPAHHNLLRCADAVTELGNLAENGGSALSCQCWQPNVKQVNINQSIKSSYPPGFVLPKEPGLSV